MRRIGLTGLAVAAFVAGGGTLASGAFAAKQVRIFEPVGGEPTLPAAVSLEVRAEPEHSFEGFEFGPARTTRGGQVAGVCSGGFTGTLESNDSASDRITLTGVEGGLSSCTSDVEFKEFGMPVGTPLVLSGFPLVLTIDAGKQDTTVSGPIAAAWGPCEFAGREFRSSHKLTFGGPLEFSLYTFLPRVHSSPRDCPGQLLLGSENLAAFGSHEPLSSALES